MFIPQHTGSKRLICDLLLNSVATQYSDISNIFTFPKELEPVFHIVTVVWRYAFTKATLRDRGVQEARSSSQRQM